MEVRGKAMSRMELSMKSPQKVSVPWRKGSSEKQKGLQQGFSTSASQTQGPKDSPLWDLFPAL